MNPYLCDVCQVKGGRKTNEKTGPLNKILKIYWSMKE